MAMLTRTMAAKLGESTRLGARVDTLTKTDGSAIGPAIKFASRKMAGRIRLTRGLS